jgi:hypothetical protein
MGERYGSERLEAACGRALAIGNPTYKSVEAILKSGLEKVALAEETEAKTVVHENIRGGDYFDCKETETEATSDIDAIEARYLEEERFAIMNEPRADATQRIPSRVLASRAAPGPEVAAAAPATTLSRLLERLQTVWTRPLPRTGREGDDPRYNQDDGSPCTSQSECVGIANNSEEDDSTQIDEARRRQCASDAMKCEHEVDERRPVSFRSGAYPPSALTPQRRRRCTD